MRSFLTAREHIGPIMLVSANYNDMEDDYSTVEP